MPASGRTKQLCDGVGGNGGKAICDGTGREILDGPLHFVNPKSRLELLRDADVGVLIEHLVDRDEMLTVFIVITRMSEVKPMWWVGVEMMHARPCRRKD